MRTEAINPTVKLSILDNGEYHCLMDINRLSNSFAMKSVFFSGPETVKFK